MRSVGSILAPPLLCVALLGGVELQRSTQLKPKDAERYHEWAKTEILKLDYSIGRWTGSDTPVPPAAVQLLKPNVILSRHYVDNLSNTNRSGDSADILIVQCRDSGDMVGHYPENCYPAGGERLDDKKEHTWLVKGVEIPLTEYLFTRSSRNQTYRRCVYNFLVVPGRGIVPDMKGVNKAAEDYQRRYFGAAQFQVVMNADIPPEDRQNIFETLIGANVGVLRVLSATDVP